MEFRFDAHQDYQLQAIMAVADLLDGQPRLETDLTLIMGAAAIANRLDLEEETLLANLQAVQAANGLAPDAELACIEAEIETATGPQTARFANFSIEMETGTGKTYVYLRTALELHRRYGLRKFIVVVPSVAVREGVLKTLQITRAHFARLFDNAPYRFYAYDSANLSQVRQFALADGVELMVMTIDSFNKATNVIRQSTDRLQGETPIHLVQATRPVLILDEPQNMESEQRVRALAALDPLFALRYSATHRNPYNVVYRLTPYEAYRQRLVKRIEVASVVKEDDVNQAYVRVEQISATAKTVSARLAIHKLMADGTVKEQTVAVRWGDDLQAKANRPEYAGFVVEEISPGGGFVRFANNVEVRRGEAHGADKEAVFEAQLRYTIEEHFRRQQRLRPAGVKVLSLFFIDRVANYAPADGVIRRLFAGAFDDLKARYPEWRDVDAATVQAAYFAERRRRSGAVELLDSTSGENKDDEAAYDLIMKDKERLLSFDEPVAFIFSHSALREGWDNPNVFQICTLNQTASEMKKRQEVGRGVRLAVDQAGERVRDDWVNVLTVVANESYDSYVRRLQDEIAADYGAEGLPPAPANARRRGVARLRQTYTLRPEFQELWERIKHKTRYMVRIDTAQVVRDVVAALDREQIRPPRVTVTKAEVTAGAGDTFTARQVSIGRTAIELTGRQLPNVIDVMVHLLGQASPPVRLTRRTLAEIVDQTLNRPAAHANPHEFASVAVRLIRDRLADQLVGGIQYERINEWYEMSRLEAEIESWAEYLEPAAHSVYDHIICDSETERAFVQGLERLGFVSLYIKLPRWFTVPTPVGDYNPDWAIVVEPTDPHGEATGQRLYLVRETKSALLNLRPDEQRKTVCGQRHFRDALGVNYKVVTSVAELR